MGVTLALRQYGGREDAGLIAGMPHAEEARAQMLAATSSRTEVGRAPRGLRGVLNRILLAVRRGLRSPWNRVLSVAFLVGQVCDMFTTHVALASGRFQEANPVFAPALASNQWLALMVKLVLACAVLTVALTKLTGSRRIVVLAVLAFISLEAPVTNALRMVGVL